MEKDFSKVKFDVILEAGQSNADGCGLGEVTCPYVPTEDILYLNNEREIITFVGGMSICYKSLPLKISVLNTVNCFITFDKHFKHRV